MSKLGSLKLMGMSEFWSETWK